MAAAVSPNDHTDVGDAGRGDGFQPVEQHRFAGDGDELFGGRVRDGTHAGAGSACEDKGLHCASST